MSRLMEQMGKLSEMRRLPLGPWTVHFWGRLFTITLTLHFINCMVYKGISGQLCDRFLPTVILLLSPSEPFYEYTTFLHYYIIVSLWQYKCHSSFVNSLSVM